MVITVTIQNIGLSPSPDELVNLGFIIMASMVVAIMYSFLLVRFRRDDIATLKCIGWDNSGIRLFVISEILFVTLSSFFILLEVIWHIVGIYFQLFAIPVGGILGIPITTQPILWWNKPIAIMLIAVGIILIAQIPGLLIATLSVTRLSPIVALRKEE
jgi:predicted lysophospholipase L1 biosynthesis ABC-type transport system permease subunit